MTAVSDTSPICYLVLASAIDILPSLYTTVLLPETVLGELLHPDAPAPVREWASKPPAWICVRPDSNGSHAGLDRLQAGERAAILLAEAVAADILFVDEKAARRAAEGRGLRITGTLGLLSEAATRGLIDLTSTVDRLRTTNFRCSPALLKAVLDRSGQP